MDLNQCFMLSTIIVMFALIVAYTHRGFKIKDLKAQIKALYNEIDKHKQSEDFKDRKIKEREYTIEKIKAELEAAKNNLEENIEVAKANERYVGKLHESFKVKRSDLIATINIIKRACRVSNKNKKVLMKELNSFLMTHHSSIVFNDLKENKLSVSQNADILKQYYANDDENVIIGIEHNSEQIEKIPSALITLILYHSKSQN